MIEKNELYNLKDETRNKFNSLKLFCKKNMPEILLFASTATLFCLNVIQYKKYGELKKNFYYKDEEINLLKINGTNKDNKINFLTDLCYLKDFYHDSTISDGMRHGSSECARQMRYKQDYLNRIKQN